MRKEAKVKSYKIFRDRLGPTAIASDFETGSGIQFLGHFEDLESAKRAGQAFIGDWLVQHDGN